MNRFQKYGCRAIASVTSTATARKLMFKICRECAEQNRAAGTPCEQCPIRGAFHERCDTLIILAEVEKEIAFRKMNAQVRR